MRLDAMGLGNVLIDDVKQQTAPLLSEAVAQYLQLKAIGKAKTFHKAALRNGGLVIDQLCDRQLFDYFAVDAGKVRDALIGRGLSVLSVRRIFTTVKAVINLAIAEHDLDIRNAPSDERVHLVCRYKRRANHFMPVPAVLVHHVNLVKTWIRNPVTLP